VTKRPHTVPKFYLSGFVDATNKGHEPYLWIGSVSDNSISRKAPKNVSIVNGYYDGQGGFENSDASLEKHLSSIEGEAAKAIRALDKMNPWTSSEMPSEIARFLAWQAARTPGWQQQEEEWANDPEFWTNNSLVEGPPPGLESAKHNFREIVLTNLETGQEAVVTDGDLGQFIRKGWKWKWSKEDRLESMHIQAWYFQVRHFPRLKWARLTAQDDNAFITSDRAVSWLVDGYADTPPSALRNLKAEVYAPLTKRIALVGRNVEMPIQVTTREVNLRIAFCASKWIAGTNREIVQQALSDRKQNLEKLLFH
jgi:Protein of unknown function (DUF4238)